MPYTANRDVIELKAHLLGRVPDPTLARILNDCAIRNQIDPPRAEKSGCLYRLRAHRVEVWNHRWARATRTRRNRSPIHDGVQLPEFPLAFRECRVGAEVVNGAGDEARIVPPWEYFKADGVVFQPAATAQPALEVASGTRLRVEDRPEPVAVCQRVVRGPFVFEEFPPLSNLGGAGRWSPKNGEPITEETPVDRDGHNAEKSQPNNSALACG